MNRARTSALLMWVGPVLWLAFTLRVYRLSGQSLWYDEGNSAFMTARSLQEIIAGAAGDIHPPLYYVLLSWWSNLGGANEFGLRFLSVAFGLLLVAVVYSLGKSLFTHQAGLAAAFIAAVSPFLVYYSQEARMYTLGALLCALAGLFLVKALDDKRYWAGYTLAAAAALYTQYYAFGVILALNVFFALAILWRRGPGVRKRWIAANVVAAILYLPWLPSLINQAAMWPRAAQTQAAGNEAMLWLTRGVLVTGLGPIEPKDPALAASVFSYLAPAFALLVILALAWPTLSRGLGGGRASTATQHDVAGQPTKLKPDSQTSEGGPGAATLAKQSGTGPAEEGNSGSAELGLGESASGPSWGSAFPGGSSSAGLLRAHPNQSTALVLVVTCVLVSWGSLLIPYWRPPFQPKFLIFGLPWFYLWLGLGAVSLGSGIQLLIDRVLGKDSGERRAGGLSPAGSLSIAKGLYSSLSIAMERVRVRDPRGGEGLDNRSVGACPPPCVPQRGTSPHTTRRPGPEHPVEAHQATPGKVPTVASIARSAPAVLIASLPILCIALVAFTALQLYYSDPRYSRDDYRGLAGHIQSQTQTGDAILLNAPGQQEIFSYYYQGRTPVHPMPRERPLDETTTGKELGDIAGRSSRLWAVLWGQRESDPNGFIERWLDQNGFKTAERWFGGVRLALYSMSGSQETSVPINARLGDYARITGITLRGGSPGTGAGPLARVASGDVVPLTIQWESLAPTPQRYKVFVHLLGPNATLWGQHDAEPAGGSVFTSGWKPGQVIADNHGLPIPPGTPPGIYEIEIGLYNMENGRRMPVFDAGGKPVGDRVVLHPVEVIRPVVFPSVESLSIEHRVNARFGSVSLLGYEMFKLGTEIGNTDFRSGDLAHLALFWRADGPAKPAGNPVRLALIDSTGRELPAESFIAGYEYPPDRWDPGEIVRAQYKISLSQPPGEYRLVVSLGAGQGGPSVQPAGPDLKLLDGKLLLAEIQVK